MCTNRCCAAYLMVIASFLSASFASMAATYGGGGDKVSRPWTDRSLSPIERANLLLKEMTLDEKIVMMHGVDPIPFKAYVGYVPPNTRLGIPALTLADGRAGVGNGARGVTLLPAPIAAASSWDPDLLNRFGKVLGEEQWGKGSNVALAPSIDVVRVPEWGRTFESYGEDPYFNSRMAVAEIQGIQSRGPIADANMYLTMNQEDNRMKEDSVVDERTLQEIYLPPFEAAIHDGNVGTVMCAYVKTNGTYSCESADLLNGILRTQLKFDGWIMSDWGATHSADAAANNGLDQEMPGDKFFGKPLKEAMSDGQVSMDVLNSHVRAILIPMFRQGLFDQAQSGNWTANVRTPQHDAFSREVAEKGTVLLENKGNILPLVQPKTIAIIGSAGGAAPRVEGGGSSGVIAPYAVSPLAGIRKRAGARVTVTYADGNDLRSTADMARSADVAIIFVHTDETEGRDRPNLKLPGNQDQLIATVAAANKRTIVVLDTGGPVLMPWLDHVDGLLEAWYPGQEDGNAIAAVLYGDFNPSAKLPLTFPRTAAELPTAHQEQWPGDDGRSIYSEKLNVGYRWYDATHHQPLFPFGFGLSYTTFQLSHLTVSASKPDNLSTTGKQAAVKLDVTNTGTREGSEVVQVYVEHPAANGEPPHELRSFAKVFVKTGETKSVTLMLDERSFSVYNSSAHRWTSPAGTYTVFVGTSSRDLPLRASITMGS
jgi:beta-glucosidase